MEAHDNVSDEEYQRGLDVLSSLISGRVRADGKNWAHAFDMMKVYLERLELETSLPQLSVIHVAGTKGKGSTCAMIESILRAAGYTTGLYTSPHLIDVRERIRINGVPIDKATFLRHLHAAYGILADKANEDSGKPAYFRFLTLLGFRIFLERDVDVAVLEVGLGGRLDATNCVRAPVVCGVTPLGFDHMDLLGHTLPEIAREKAGIFKPGVPAFSVQQRDDAAAALREVADRAGTPLAGVRAIEEYKVEVDGGFKGAEALEIGLAGEHQRQNAALAVALAAEWEATSGKGGEAAKRRAAAVRRGELPAEYVAGLQAARWPGRGQIVEDPTQGPEVAATPSNSRLTFFLDGAHTAESMATCGRWFADAVGAVPAPTPAASAAGAAASTNGDGEEAPQTHRVLVFNCMEERDPAALLAPLAATLRERGALPPHALFVPPESTYMKLGRVDEVPDLAWQLNLRSVWEKMVHGGSGVGNGTSIAPRVPRLPPLPPVVAAGVPAVQDAAVGAVLPSLQHTLEWLRRCVRDSPSLRMQVLVTGSLYLVGDMLRLLGTGAGGKAPGHGGSSGDGAPP